MAYLEKKILVTIPVTEAHKTYLEKQALMRGNFLRTIRHTIAMIAPYAASDNIIPKKNT